MQALEVESQWPDRLRALLALSPVIEDLTIETQWEDELDGWVEFQVDGQLHRLVVECKSSGQPRYVERAVLHLGREILRAEGLTRGLFIAPFVSPASRGVLREANTGWLDFAGNARIVFPKFHLEIERENHDPFVSKREQRSLFYPKSARVLKVLLRPPLRPWRVAELASNAEVSTGQVSNVRHGLLERGWAKAQAREGLMIVEPQALLDAWKDYDAPGDRVAYRGYTLLHGKSLAMALGDAFDEAQRDGARLLLASHSVARRLAPFARIAGEYLYADSKGLDILKRHLSMRETDKGENVTVFPFENTLMDDAVEIDSSLFGTDPIQTYLDLLQTGERGREAADHWRKERIEPHLAAA